MSALAAAQPRGGVRSPELCAADLYERHRRAVYGFCYAQLRRREDADDAVQTTFIYALTSLRRGIVPEFELPWLFTIARNVCSTRRRTNMRRGVCESPEDLECLQDCLASPERSAGATTADFAAVLQALPETQRQALLLREWRGLSYDEIGAELGLSQSATEALLFRARRNAAQRLGERTGLRAALQGLPFLSFFRGLFQTAAATTLAVGGSAAIGLVALPAGHEARHGVAPRQAPAVVQPRAPSRVPPPIRSSTPHHRSAPPQPHTLRTRAVAEPRVRARHVSVPAHPAAAAPAPQPQPQAQPNTPAAPPPTQPVGDPPAVTVTVPTIATPAVETPALTVPVTPSVMVSVPSLQLP